MDTMITVLLLIACLFGGNTISEVWFGGTDWLPWFLSSLAIFVIGELLVIFIRALVYNIPLSEALKEWKLFG